MGENKDDLRPARSYLYVPGNDARLLAGADLRRPDAIIADLEDAVAPADKVPARRTVSDWLARRTGAQQWVRVNADSVSADLDAVVGPNLTGVVVPKADCRLIKEVAAHLDRLEAQRRLLERSIVLVPLIESASGLMEVGQIARLPRLHRIGVGEVDLAADLGVELDEERQHLTAIRLQVVTASAAAGVARPLGSTSTAFRDLKLFDRTSRNLRKLGFRGRTAIHPQQIPVIHEVFTPSDDDVVRARRLLDLSCQADSGTLVDDEGRFVDAAVLRSAEEILAVRALADATDRSSG